MKMRIGNRLYAVREERKLNQMEMAELLGISPSTYSRLERNETGCDFEQLAKFSEQLKIPIQEFLPETISITSSNNQNQQGHIGFVVGNIYNYCDDKLLQENHFLKEKIILLEKRILELENFNSILQENTTKHTNN